MNTSRFQQTLSIIVLLLIIISISGSVSADCEEELEATKKELAQVEEERDEYAEKLEDSTTIIIITLGGISMPSTELPATTPTANLGV